MKKYLFGLFLFVPGMAHAISFITPVSTTAVLSAKQTWTAQQNFSSGIKGSSSTFSYDVSSAPILNVMSVGALGDCVTDDQAAFNSAVQTLEAQNVNNAGVVLIPNPPGGCYLLSKEITISSTSSGIRLLGMSKYVQLQFSSTSGNGIHFLGNHDNFIAENLDLKAINNSSGTAIISTNTTSSTPLRDFEFRDVNLEFFANGINIWGQLNGKIIGGRQGGQGKGSGHGYSGIQLGNDVNDAGDGTQIENVYVSNFDIGLNAVYDEPVDLVGLNLFGGCSTGVFVGPTSILYEAGEINFDSNNDWSIANQGYMIYAAAFSSIGTQTVATTNHRMFYTGHSFSRIEAYVSTSPVVPNNSYTLAQFNASVENTEGYFSTTTYLYTAPYPGYRVVDATIRWDINVATAQYQSAIYVNGAIKKQFSVYGPAAPLPASKVVSVPVHDLIWLNTGDTVGIYAYQNEGGNANIHGGSLSNWLTIFDQ